MTPTPRNLTFLSAKEVARCLPSTADAIAVIEAAYRAKASGEGRLGLRGYMDASEHPSGTFFTTQGIVPSRNVAGSKVIGSFPGNRQRNLPSESGLLTLFDASTGHPLAIMDAGVITAMRTGGVSALGAKYLARQDSRVLGVIGTGSTAYWSIRFIADMFHLEEVRVHSRNQDSCALFANNLSAELKLPVRSVSSWQECLENADILLDAAMLDQHQPLLKTQWIKPGALVIVFGIRSSMEIDVCSHMNKIVVDDWNKSPPAGPNGALWPQIESGKLSRNMLHAEIDEIIQGTATGRSDSRERILYWHRGMVLCDILIASLVLDSARQQNLGVHAEM